MTSKELYEQSCSLIYEIPYDDDNLKDAFPAILNQIMHICLPYENMFRKSNGQVSLSRLPVCQNLDEPIEIPFCDEISHMAMPYAVQSKFLEADDDKKAESVLAYNRFVEMLNNITPAVEMELDYND